MKKFLKKWWIILSSTPDPEDTVREMLGEKIPSGLPPITCYPDMPKVKSPKAASATIDELEQRICALEKLVEGKADKKYSPGPSSGGMPPV